MVYWQRCALSHRLQTAALAQPDREALIWLDTYMRCNSPAKGPKGDLFPGTPQVNMPRVSQHCWSLGNINPATSTTQCLRSLKMLFKESCNIIATSPTSVSVQPWTAVCSPLF